MSDGPHRSLPMRPGWKKVAQYADNEAFAPNEVRDALMAAIEKDWRKDISPGFVSCIQDILGGETLFSDDSIQALEDLRQSVAGCPMENALLDHVVYAVSNVRSRDTALHEALACTLTDWSARRARQIEEHFLRESSAANTLAVAGLTAREMGEKLVRVRLGGKKHHPCGPRLRREPFTSAPYKVRPGEKGRSESSRRSRGFKFSMISGLAAYLSNANRIIVPESGQGALGPSLVPVGQAYPDYRSHPSFTRRMERFLEALLRYQVRYEFPHIWNTKGQTLARFINECEDGSMAWAETRSCWQQNRQIGVNSKARQCGICAAYMLRRLTVHAAGQVEEKTTYVWEELGADTFEARVSPDFGRGKITRAMKEYAIAGTLHLDHLAGLIDSPANAPRISLEAFRLGQSLGLPQSTVKNHLNRLLTQHKSEWESFMASLGPTSFVAKWAFEVRS